ncbi:hypothetical protein JR316_0010541 [Psilocybe cubensis]|uniref:Uncharacterized protein n=2 Tax=Psilocybe cubensis TaxID=181762 RepID=A0ACB8GLQ7_PSICU|nr:hypothetical protein JR316_0010541 [Psilocybe cubensis]KAH9476628.1 hypothetical protein JR316_0010541 [Psilocybe cubensis]
MSAIHTRSRPSIAHDPGPSYRAIDDYEMDYETSALIAQLALQDIEQAYSSRKGKSRFGAGLTDEEVAYQLQLESFQRLLAESEDAKLARSLDAAVCADAVYLEAVMVAEEAANADRRAAQLLSRGERLPKPTAAQARVESRGFVMHPESQRNSMPQPAYEVPVNDYDDDISDTESYIGEFDRMQLEKYVKWKMAESKARVTEGRPKAAPSPNATAGPSVNRNRTVACLVCTEKLHIIPGGIHNSRREHVPLEMLRHEANPLHRRHPIPIKRVDQALQAKGKRVQRPNSGENLLR